MKQYTMMNNNRLIAEFMGVDNEISLDSIAANIHSWSDAPFFYITEDSKEKVMEGIAEYSKYHTSWDWLMPVVNKIRVSYNNTEITGEKCEDIISVLAEGCIEANIIQVYEAVVEFIKDQVCHVELQEWEKSN